MNQYVKNLYILLLIPYPCPCSSCKLGIQANIYIALDALLKRDYK